MHYRHPWILVKKYDQQPHNTMHVIVHMATAKPEVCLLNVRLANIWNNVCLDISVNVSFHYDLS